MIKHTEEFEQEAVRIALTSGLPRDRVASDLGIGKSTLGKWVSQYRPSDLASAPQADLARENERLRLENRVLREEREVLKKATQFFASQRPRSLRLCIAGGTGGPLNCSAVSCLSVSVAIGPGARDRSVGGSGRI